MFICCVCSSIALYFKSILVCIATYVFPLGVYTVPQTPQLIKTLHFTMLRVVFIKKLFFFFLIIKKDRRSLTVNAGHALPQTNYVH